MSDPFLSDLQEAVGVVQAMPRVEFFGGLHEGADRWLAKKHANGAVHEPATLAAMLASVAHRECRHIFDVGALWGYFACFAKMACPNADVTAFEAHPIAIKPLAANVERGVSCVWAVVSDVERSNVKVWMNGFNIYEEPDGGWERLDTIPGALKSRITRGWAYINFTTIDAYCQEAKVEPDLIKIDVEAYQGKAVRGAIETLRKHRPYVVIELHDPDKLARFGITNKDTVRPLFDLGYRAYWCGNHRDKDATFVPVQQMGAEHEKLSIMVFAP